jgi:hypothetical protein
MARFILRYQGKGSKPQQSVGQIRSLDDISIIDDSSPRMILVDAPEEKLKALVDSMPDWVMSQERTYHLPDPRPRLR